MTGMAKIRYFMLTLLAALTLGLAGVAQAGGGDSTSDDSTSGAEGSDTMEGDSTSDDSTSGAEGSDTIQMEE
ncbi:MAG: hypothetical protein R6V11_06545, partial [Ectothiorhodospiraceae bacterium]